MVSERSLAVLHAIVSDYVSSREPVGSKAIVERHHFGVSAATIRNDMALLEEDELITQPHTSSGRVPTDKGYRLYVDTLAKLRPISAAQRSAIERFLSEASDLDDVMARTVRLLAQLTNQVAVVQYPSLRRVNVRHLDLVLLAPNRVLCVLILGNGVVEQQVALVPTPILHSDEALRLRDRIAAVVVGSDIDTAVTGVEQLLAQCSQWELEVNEARSRAILAAVLLQLRANRSEKIAVAGAANLSRIDEFEHQLPAVLDAIEEQVTLLRLFDELVHEQRDVAASIGRENSPYGFSETSILASRYDGTGGEHGAASRLGVLGPMRMDYAGNIAVVRAVARYLHRLLGDTHG